MHFNKCKSFIFLPFIFWPSAVNGQRRIINGRTTNINATFVVYLLRGEPATVNYKGWLCGGSIVDRWFVLTSAACLEDVQYVYVVAGYHKYVSSERMQNDACITKTRKKIISWCRQSKYSFGDLTQTDDWYESRLWATSDIALARVHEPFDFHDHAYLQYCSYLPTMISVAMSIRQQVVGTPVIAYGWGHRKYFRLRTDTTDYNSEALYYAQMRIISREKCAEIFDFDFIQDNIRKNCICTSGLGYLDDEGLFTNLMNLPNTQCKNDTCRRNWPQTRRQGTCQNDHGGPLITWYGGRQYVVGVASFFRVNGEHMCVSPFVFISTVCVDKFLICVLSRTRRTQSCAAEYNIRIVENHLNWTRANTEKPEVPTVPKFAKVPRNPKFLWKQEVTRKPKITEVPKIPQMTETPEVLQTPKIPDPPGREMPDLLEVHEIPEITDMPETPEVPESPETTDMPETSVTPETPEMPESPETTDMPETPEMPELAHPTDIPETPETPEISEAPESPETRDMPETSVTPETPEMPEASEVPEIPQMQERLDIPENLDMSEAQEMPEVPEFLDILGKPETQVIETRMEGKLSSTEELLELYD